MMMDCRRLTTPAPSRALLETVEVLTHIVGERGGEYPPTDKGGELLARLYFDSEAIRDLLEAEYDAAVAVPSTQAQATNPLTKNPRRV